MAFHIISERCTNCAHCVDYCPRNAIVFGDSEYGVGRFKIKPELCIECGACQAQCNRDAIIDPAKPENPVPPHDLITLDCDVVVIGSGASGAPVAAKAVEAGKKVVALEKGRHTGGSGFYAYGIFARGSKYVMETTGCGDDREEAIVETIERTEGKLDPELIRKTVYAIGPYMDWVCDLGNLWDELAVGEGPYPYAVGPRNKKAGARNGGLGRKMIDALLGYAEKGGALILTQTAATDLVVENGTVVAVHAQDPGGRYYIKCKACMLATGSFCMDPELRGRYEPLFSDTYIMQNSHAIPELTGDGTRMAVRAGAAFDEEAACVNMLGPYPLPSYSFLMSNSRRDRMYVGSNGKRFTDESKIDFARLISQPRGICYAIFDSTQFEETNAREIESGKTRTDSHRVTAEQLEAIPDLLKCSLKTFAKADTVAELAEQLGMNSIVLKRSVDRYNGFAAEGKDRDFGKVADLLHPIITAPYYAIMLGSGPHGGCGGLVVTSDMEVKAADGSIIRGLYSAGDMVAGQHINVLGDKVRILNDLSWACASGYIAGNQIIEYLSKQQ